MEWLWLGDFSDLEFLPLVLDGVTLPQIDIVHNLEIILKQLTIMTTRAFAQLCVYASCNLSWLRAILSIIHPLVLSHIGVRSTRDYTLARQELYVKSPLKTNLNFN